MVRNPVDVDRFKNQNSSVSFKEFHRLSDYILCVGRIEPRKNQLLLAVAAHELNVPLVLIGHVGDPHYLEQTLRWGGEKLLHLDRLEPDDPLFLSSFLQASCFALPSFSEGAPLAALEAAACKCSMVLSDRSGEQEYFGNFAHYCDPSSIDSIKNCLTLALNRFRTKEGKTRC